jgi:uncharacterized protein YegL
MGVIPIIDWDARMNRYPLEFLRPPYTQGHAMTTRIKSLVAAVALALGAAAPSLTSAATIDLGFIIDESGSISSSEFNTIRTGLANAINTLVPIGGANTYRISVVKFDNDAETVVNRILVDSAAARTSVVNAINGMSQEGGTTNYQAAFSLMQSVLTANNNVLGTAYVNFATDGEPNDPGNNSQAQAAAITARNNLIAAGVDNISIEGIGVSSSAAAFLQGSICYPAPCDSTLPYNFPAQGFYIGVANAAGYAAAIGNKIQVVTGQVPEPGSIALFGTMLLGLGFSARRKAQAAK